MFIQHYSRKPTSQYGPRSVSTAVYRATVPEGLPTLEAILACCQANTALNLAILKKLNLRGFRKAKPSRAELSQQNQLILNEIRTLKSIIRRGDTSLGDNQK
jgi:hypothetical protein